MSSVITIDGPSGSGKGTIAQRLAEHLGWRLLDSGAIYRVLAFLVDRAGISIDQTEKIVEIAGSMQPSFDSGQVLLDGEDVSHSIRTETIGNLASKIAAIAEVRKALLQWQRDYAQAPGLVADGRDMGTVVFPHAAAKIFLTASAEERAKRRYKQLKQKGLDVNLADLACEIQERDERDLKRSNSPLMAAAEALYLDSTELDIEQVFALVMDKVLATFADKQA